MTQQPGSLFVMRPTMTRVYGSVMLPTSTCRKLGESLFKLLEEVCDFA